MPLWALSPVSHWGKIFRGRKSQTSGFYHLQLDFHLHAHQKQLTHIKGLQGDRGQGLPERSTGAETNAREREQEKKEAGQGVCSSFFERQWKCFRGTGQEKPSRVRGRAGSDKERFHCKRGWHSTNLSPLALSLDLTSPQAGPARAPCHSHLPSSPFLPCLCRAREGTTFTVLFFV